MYIYIYTHMYIHINIYVFIDIYTYVCVYIYICHNPPTPATFIHIPTRRDIEGPGYTWQIGGPKVSMEKNSQTLDILKNSVLYTCAY